LPGCPLLVAGQLDEKHMHNIGVLVRSGVARTKFRGPKIRGGEMFDFRRITLLFWINASQSTKLLP